MCVLLHACVCLLLRNVQNEVSGFEALKALWKGSNQSCVLWDKVLGAHGMTKK